ncbi:DUF927 domain-containing protein [Rhodocytophaga rosea]|uniref:DUF927 domain-containing protein n=1 Tax=Rhodocytophaga rosea TaxID=2704465 RepID=A0A6C0GCX9_9BACT|nr:DUF927 domain-containing protein [Rhodocytophaga rosea]QHT65673.1 DUF927 domain-containing protein [Rhodocytophaga rosea]
MNQSNGKDEIQPWEVEQYKKHKFYEKDNCLYTLKFNSDQPSRKQISNFSISVLYFIKGHDQSQRVIKLKNQPGVESILTINSDKLASVAEFTKFLEREGNFIFYGSALDLTHIKIKLFNDEKRATQITVLGQHTREDFFTFCNGIWQKGKFYPADQYGIINLGNKHFHIPYASSILKEDDSSEEDKQNENYIRFTYKDSSVTFKQWSSKFAQVYSYNGQVALAFAIAAIFRDIIFDELGFFPILDNFGQPQTGKSTLMESLLYLFGEKQPRISLASGTSTPKAITRTMGQFRNALIFIDEYKNRDELLKIAETLKGMYDGTGSLNAAFTNDSRTRTNKILSSVLLAGQDLPNLDPALFTRCILLDFTEKKFNDESMNQLKALQQEGLTFVLTQILEIRSYFKDKFKEVFEHEYRELSKNLLAHQYPDRLLKNYTILLACVEITNKHLQRLPFEKTDFENLVKKRIKEQNSLMNSTDDLKAFFDVVQFLYEQGKITEEKDFCFSKGDGGKRLYLYMISIHPLYLEAKRRQGGKTLDKGTLELYIKAQKDIFIKQGNAKFQSTIDKKYDQKHCVHLHVEPLTQRYELWLGRNTNLEENQEIDSSAEGPAMLSYEQSLQESVFFIQPSNLPTRHN